jgi:uncharacterized protein with NRDE domain
MCLVVIALDAHPAFSLVLAANRDEYHARPAAQAAWGDGAFAGILAGRDLAAGGTWLGVGRDGRFALVTNVRDGKPQDPAAPSRGAIVPQLLAAPLGEGLAALAREAPRYNGFNVLAGHASSVRWMSNRGGEPRRIEHGVHGLSNALLDVPWPKVVRTERRLEAWIASESTDVAPLFDALADHTRAADGELPSTGVALEWERILSSPFIATERYGTRCSTVYTVDREGRATFRERSFAPDGAAIGDVRETFLLSR